MVNGGGGPLPGPASKPASTMESAGGRVRFRVELRPDETTIVSWKKLLREANLSDSARPDQSDTGTSCKAQQQPISQAPLQALPVASSSSSKQPLENEQKDLQAQPGSNRLSNVIERIERMYAGNGSSDEEDVRMDNVPDDDEYDTEDSFIDDTELDDYFQVDNSAIKHDGFFVNRGELERIEPPTSTSNQPKKRRHKDLTRGHGGSEGHDMNKTVKIGNKGKKASSLLQINLTSQPHIAGMSNVHGENMPFEGCSTNASEISSIDKAAGSADPSGLLNGNSIHKDMNTAPKRPGGPLPTKWKESNSQDSSARLNDKGSNVSKSYSGKQSVDVGDVVQLSQKKEKSGLVENFDLNVPASRDTLSTPKTVLMQRKEGSSIRPKSSTLEKAIPELEKIVAEFRPATTEVQDPDNSSQAVKRRLPPEVKQKLAKVARIVQQANDGKIPKDVINRLMGIVGHLMQVRTLKRNLKVLANVGLSAKQEKEDKIQKIKQEVAEMVKLRIQHIRSNADQQVENLSDFQEGGPEENKVLKHKYKMDDVLQNKICELYDLYVERVDEDSSPPVKRLYEELVSLWPSGYMDTDGIKCAIYRAKQRRGACSINKEKIKQQPKSGGTTKPTQTCHPSDKDANVAAHAPVASATALSLDKAMSGKASQESSNSIPTEAVLPNSLPKKKVKRKPKATQVTEAQPRLKQSDKQHVSVPLSKSNLLPAVPPA